MDEAARAFLLQEELLQLASVTSASTKRPRPNAEAVDFPTSWERSATMTLAPSWDSFSAMPLPNLDAAPVAMATLPSSHLPGMTDYCAIKRNTR